MSEMRDIKGRRLANNNNGTVAMLDNSSRLTARFAMRGIAARL
jgi:hypothetical protein